MGKNSGGGTTVQTNDPWTAQQPHLKFGFDEAKRLYQNFTPEFFPNRTFANQSPETQAALNLQSQRAVGGSPLQNIAKAQTGLTAAGGYLNANPYLNNMFDQAAGRVAQTYQTATAPTVDGNFSAAGRYGSGSHRLAQSLAADKFGETLTDLATNIYGGNYARERQNQMRAIESATPLAQQDYFDIGQLANVGAQREEFDQRGIDESMNRWAFEQDRPYSMLDRYLGTVQGNYGGTTSTTVPNYRSPFGGALGGGLAGYQIGGTPGALAGGGLGLLGGLFG